MKKQKIDVKGTEVVIFSKEKEDYISLTDIAKYKDSERSDYILQNWMINRKTIEFIGLWEQLQVLFRQTGWDMLPMSLGRMGN